MPGISPRNNLGKRRLPLLVSLAIEKSTGVGISAVIRIPGCLLSPKQNERHDVASVVCIQSIIGICHPSL
jgi:hypothetical protein